MRCDYLCVLRNERVVWYGLVSSAMRRGGGAVVGHACFGIAINPVGSSNGLRSHCFRLRLAAFCEEALCSDRDTDGLQLQKHRAPKTCRYSTGR
jgi:hypothetical protein